MGTHVTDSRLFGDQFGTPRMREIFSDEATVQRWLDVEAALARVQARLGIIPEAAARAICDHARVELLDLDAMKREMDRTSHPIVPLLRAVQAVCPGDAAEWIHWGATTQDIMDTGTVLQLRDALAEIEAALRDLLAALCALARTHRDTVMAGRTHGQQALPITFGFKAAVWAAEVARHLDRIAEMRPRLLVGQFGGAVGTLAALGAKGEAVRRELFEELGLGVPTIAWHTARDGMAECACVLAIVASTAGKMAQEVYALQKTETAELEEPFAHGKIGSSTMPHKRNPAVCETIAALARAARAVAPQAIEGVMAEHERDKIVLQSEREWTARLCCLTHAALVKCAWVMRGLSVRADAMARNLSALDGLLMSERVMFALGHRFGKQEAHEMVYKVCMAAFEAGRPLREALLADPRIVAALPAGEIDRLLDPRGYTGMAGAFVDRVLEEVAPKLPPGGAGR
jgi:3-carboxy-cis,cis-muconate cycloisomerase